MNRKNEGKQTYLFANTFLSAWYIEKLICNTYSNNVKIFKKKNKKKKKKKKKRRKIWKTTTHILEELHQTHNVQP